IACGYKTAQGNFITTALSKVQTYTTYPLAGVKEAIVIAVIEYPECYRQILERAIQDRGFRGLRHDRPCRTVTICFRVACSRNVGHPGSSNRSCLFNSRRR